MWGNSVSPCAYGTTVVEADKGMRILIGSDHSTDRYYPHNMRTQVTPYILAAR